MRLGGQVFVDSNDPQVVAKAHWEEGYRAAFAPGDLRLADTARIAAIREAYAGQDVVIAEVGVWNNLMDPDEAKRNANIEAMKAGVVLAEELGALCAVNIAGSLNPDRWDGPHPGNLGQDAFDLTGVIDAMKPGRTKLTYEMMPFCIPDSADCYLRLIEAVDRPAFGVHLDVINIINGVYRYFDTTSVIEECFEKLGPHIVACHLKDITLSDELTVHLSECMVGEGDFDIATYLLEVQKLPHQPPVLLEHLKTKEEFDHARTYVLGLAQQIGVDFGG